MGSQTASLKMPYPVGTDRVMDGDNAMQALAERIEARMPWGYLAHTAMTTTSPVGTSAQVISSGTLTVTVGAGRRIRLSALMGIIGTAAGQNGVLSIYEGN